MNGREEGKWSDVTADKRVMVIGEGTPAEGFTAYHVQILGAPAAAGQ